LGKIQFCIAIDRERPGVAINNLFTNKNTSTTMGIVKDLATKFAKGAASAAGGSAATKAVDALMGALGLGSDAPDYSGQLNEMTAELHKIDDDLLNIDKDIKTMISQLDKIDKHLLEINDDLHRQELQATRETWLANNCSDNIKVIEALWKDAIYDSQTKEKWVNDVLETNITHELSAISSAIRMPETSPLKLYADLIINQVQFQFPVTEPWQPSLNFYNYCKYLLHQYWCATAMAKTAHFEKGETTQVGGCVNEYLDFVKEFESQAFINLVRVLEAVNKWVNEMGGSFPMLYEPFFTVEDFQFLDIFDEQEKLDGHTWRDTPNYTLKGVDTADLFQSNMGKDIENFEKLMSEYRPVSEFGQKGGRISIYLSFWDNFYKKHKSDQQLRTIKIVSPSGHRHSAEEPEILSTNLELFVSESISGLYGVQLYGQDVEYNGNKLGSAQLRDLFVFGNPNVKFKRWTYFVPFGTYRVDAGDRLKWQYGTDVYTFMGKSNYATEGVTITENAPAEIMRWSPWDGAFLMTNDPTGNAKVIK
jgi:hypothetical protein